MPMWSSSPAPRLPLDAAHEERAVYVVAGAVDIAGDRFPAGQFAGAPPRRPDHRRNADERAARLILIGGATMDGPRYIWWNFVSSRRERIEQAKADWKAGSFGTVPGDDEEFIPLPADNEVASYP